MTSYPGTPLTDLAPPSLEEWIAWPAVWCSFWWALQLECLNQLSNPTTLAFPPWIGSYNGMEQLA
jgi:hypothetical protein